MIGIGAKVYRYVISVLRFDQAATTCFHCHECVCRLLLFEVTKTLLATSVYTPLHKYIFSAVLGTFAYLKAIENTNLHEPVA